MQQTAIISPSQSGVNQLLSKTANLPAEYLSDRIDVRRVALYSERIFITCLILNLIQ